MKKIVLASAISALFAAPVAAFAQAKAPAAPTLDKVLEASGITESGYIDAGYTYSNRNLEGTSGKPAVSTRVFDSQNNSFALHQLGLTLAKQPKEGFGGLVNITAGRDANVIQSSTGAGLTTTPNATFDVTQAYAQWAGGPLTAIAGKFTTLAGTEVIASTGNNNVSRSMLFGAVPFTHTGVRGTWAASDTINVIVGLNNGWDQLTDSNRQKTVELGVTLNPIKPLNIAVSGYSGDEISTVTGSNGVRTMFDIVASWAFTDALSVGLEYLDFSQDKAVASGKAKYSGFAGYASYLLTPKYRASVRLESFDDHDGFHFGTTGLATPGTKYTEGTLTLAYLAADNFELRAEVREDKANQAVFVDYSGNTSKTLMTMAVQGLYKF
ncbi:MAG TPA: outer membrane beta-barrel protein [Burkholderiales bacterium]|nr:outer membrane beta-barrel protein [Burkholderiales bacterium]